MIETARLNSYLSKNPLHFEWADKAESLGYRPAERLDDSHTVSNGRLRIAFIGGWLEIDGVEEMESLLAERPTDQEFLKRILTASESNGFKPYAVPYDILVFLLLDRRRDNKRTDEILSYLPYKAPLFDALSMEILGRKIEAAHDEGENV